MDAKGTSNVNRFLIGLVVLLLAGNAVTIGLLIDRDTEQAAVADPTPSVSVLAEEFRRDEPTDPVTPPVVADEVETPEVETPVVVTPPDPDPEPEPPSQPRTTTRTTPQEPTTSTGGSGGSTSAACRNSTNRSCGDFYWSPDPKQDKQVTIEGFISPSSPTVGETVTFTATATDPDAQPNCCAIIIDGQRFGEDISRSCPTRYGAWDTPARDGGSETYSMEFVFDEAGTHTVKFVTTSGDTCKHPYGGKATMTIEFVVNPA